MHLFSVRGLGLQTCVSEHLQDEGGLIRPTGERCHLSFTSVGPQRHLNRQ